MKTKRLLIIDYSNVKNKIVPNGSELLWTVCDKAFTNKLYVLKYIELHVLHHSQTFKKRNYSFFLFRKESLIGEAMVNSKPVHLFFEEVRV